MIAGVARLLRRRGALVLPLPLLLLACAYYNTFYIAKKSFRAAEESVAKSQTDKLPSDASGNYDMAIKQSRKVLKRHSGSRWVDDAIYLMGASYYGKGDYDSALASFGQLNALFPESEFRADALFLSGMSRTKRREYDLATAMFDSVLSAFPRYKRRDEILFAMAGTEASRRDFAAAVRRYRAVAREFPKGRFADRALMRVGEIQFEAGRYDSAYAALDALLGATRDEKAKIEAAIAQGRVLLKLKRPEEALELLKETEPAEAAGLEGDRSTGASQAEQPPIRADLADDLARLRLGQAAAMNEMGRHREAIEALEKIVTRFASSSYAAEAQFQIGYTYETRMDSLASARAAYEKVSQLAGRSVFKDQAPQRAKAIQAQMEMEGKAGSGDAEAEERAAAALRVAEILYLDRELADEALLKYSEVERDFPESRFAPRAAYARAYIKWKVAGDSLGAHEDLRVLVHRYPASTQARGAIALLAAHGADTSGLRLLLTAVVPESTAAGADTTGIPPDTTAAAPDSIGAGSAPPSMPADRPSEPDSVRGISPGEDPALPDGVPDSVRDSGTDAPVRERPRRSERAAPGKPR